MMAGLIRAEFIKLRSTKSPWWTTAVLVVVVLGLSYLLGFGAAVAFGQYEKRPEDGLPAGAVADLTAGVGALTGFGSILLLIMVTITVTGEYRFGTMHASLTATPRRWPVVVAKLIVGGGLSALLSLLLAPVGTLLYRTALGKYGDHLDVWAAGAWAIYGTVALYGFMLAALAIGVGLLVRHTAAALGIVLLWVLVLEGLIGLIPEIGKKITGFLPFANFQRFLASLGENAPLPGASENFLWSPTGSLIYFVVVCLFILFAGVVVLRKRDS